MNDLADSKAKEFLSDSASTSNEHLTALVMHVYKTAFQAGYEQRNDELIVVNPND